MILHSLPRSLPNTVVFTTIVSYEGTNNSFGPFILRHRSYPGSEMRAPHPYPPTRQKSAQITSFKKLALLEAETECESRLSRTLLQ